MKHRMFMVVVALAATLALAAPVGAASSHSQGATNASTKAWHNWASFDGGMAPGLVPANDPAADENNGDEVEVDEDGGDEGTEAGDDQGDDEQADEDGGDQGTGAEDDQGDNEQADDNGGDSGSGDSTDDTTDDTGAGRPQNHGWFVSQCAHDTTFVGKAHGQHMKECAHGQNGKPAKGGDSGDSGDSGSGDTGSGDTRDGGAEG
jgi:hypothetical protein